MMTSPLRRFGFLALAVALLAPTAPASPPNIILFVADDLGWTDLACFGSGYYRTPNIDRLARTGIRFTAAYTCGPNCAPTRACLMSGQYSPRHGIYTVSTGARGQAKFRKLIPVVNRTVLDTGILTLAERLQSAGYATAHFGKWHLGPPPQAGPRQQGFDINFGGNKTGSPRGGYFSPYKNPQLKDGPPGENLTDRLATEAHNVIRQHVRNFPRKPFFVYLPFYAVHTPIQAKQKLAAEYAKRKPAGGHGNPKYAAMVETMDAGVGRVLATIDELKLTGETVVIFTSDNGGLGGYGALGGSTGRSITDNAPLRGGKGMLYEGGIRVPLIARWPGQTRAGATCSTPIITVDFYPTLAEIAGTTLPADQVADGVSFTPLLRGGSLPDRSLFWHFPGYLQANARKGTWRTTPAGAVRSGDWKLIEFFEDGRRELYHTGRDIGETRDLAADQPDVANSLFATLQAWRTRVKAPLPTRSRR
ncbi:MAG: sulfatase [Planctomycetaceae bacterium]|nr:sulfatase [Planctomycetaceae bacterium]